ncbi:MAG: S-methyl-5'-thioadenosine phosphorylase [Candidatus Njordarchaeales archaeon]
MSTRIDVGVIGGSGFYEFFSLESMKEVLVKTPFGSVNVVVGNIGSKRVAFIARHGKGHKLPPHKINYRANAYAMFKLGVKYVIATNAVGSIRKDFPPGSLVVPNQVIDFTKSRIYTFFDGEFEIEFPDGRKKKGVVHTDVTEPYCEFLRKKIISAAKELGVEIFDGGTYVCTEGPRFETPAEIRFFAMIGGDLVGMTGVPEVFLFKELEICYATICIVTNYAAGLQDRVSHEEVLQIFDSVKPKVIKIIEKTITSL